MKRVSGLVCCMLAIALLLSTGCASLADALPKMQEDPLADRMAYAESMPQGYLMSVEEADKTYVYEISGEYAIITGYKGKETKVVFPGMIDQYVVMQPDKPIFANSSVISVTVLAKIERVPDKMFYGCTFLNEVILPDSVTAIGECAFQECKALTKITLPDSVSSIGEEAFSQSGLKSFTLPPKCTEVPFACFQYCYDLEKVELHGECKEIGVRAFESSYALKRITLPEGLESIERNAFANSGLREVTLPKSIKHVDLDAFDNCQYLKEIIKQ